MAKASKPFIEGLFAYRGALQAFFYRRLRTKVDADDLVQEVYLRLVIPKDRSVRLRRTIAGIFDRKTLWESLESRLRLLNPVLRGWGKFYRHARGAKRIFAAIDHHV